MLESTWETFLKRIREERLWTFFSAIADNRTRGNRIKLSPLAKQNKTNVTAAAAKLKRIRAIWEQVIADSCEPNEKSNRWKIPGFI